MQVGSRWGWTHVDSSLVLRSCTDFGVGNPCRWLCNGFIAVVQWPEGALCRFQATVCTEAKQSMYGTMWRYRCLHSVRLLSNTFLPKKVDVHGRLRHAVLLCKIVGFRAGHTANLPSFGRNCSRRVLLPFRCCALTLPSGRLNPNLRTGVLPVAHSHAACGTLEPGCQPPKLDGWKSPFVSVVAHANWFCGSTSRNFDDEQRVRPPQSIYDGRLGALASYQHVQFVEPSY